MVAAVTRSGIDCSTGSPLAEMPATSMRCAPAGTPSGITADVENARSAPTGARPRSTGSECNVIPTDDPGAKPDPAICTVDPALATEVDSRTVTGSPGVVVGTRSEVVVDEGAIVVLVVLVVVVVSLSTRWIVDSFWMF